MDYWKECIEVAFEEAGIAATDEQIKSVVEVVEGGHENYGMAHGHDCIPDPLKTENEALEKKLKIEIEKIHCQECNGIGTITDNFLNRSSTTQCWKCRGEGRYTR